LAAAFTVPASVTVIPVTVTAPPSARRMKAPPRETPLSPMAASASCAPSAQTTTPGAVAVEPAYA
jgi:hypothetical protein